ncbi:glycosyltransferase family 2 protein [Piscinibacter sp.]|uniref:glycosyltransferase family 2 protein n=1 Tax=Piscinibacter sp. TaxID=1903157 RepID=UPI0039E5E99D
MLETLLCWLAVGCPLLAVYSYAIYPVVLAIVAAAVQLREDARYVASKSGRRVREGAELPRVGVVISAYNEQRHIRERVQNLLALDYPAHLVTFYIGSDGSKDDTGAILGEMSHAQLKAFVFERNRGKANVLNDLVSRVEEPIVAFSDANTFFAPDALKRLAVHFADARVGGVSGELRLLGSAGDNQDSLYWRIEQVLKFFESRIGGLLGANGAIYAIRRELWRPLEPDTICDDFCVAMNVAAAGYRLVYEPNAIATEDTPDNISEEYKRRVRIGIGNYQALWRHPEYLLKTSAGTKFSYVSHKVLRWLTPHLVLVGLLACVPLALGSPAWAWVLAAELAAIAVAAWLYGRSAAGRKLPGLLRIPAFLFALNWAFLVGSIKFVRGTYGGAWARTSR